MTPSYRLDFERCALLNRSLQACAPSFEHWIIVDRGDLPAFRSLQTNTTNVVAKEDVLPRRVRRLDTLKVGLRSNVWLQSGGVPIRGWLLQQLVKLAAAEYVSADVLVHADSDVVMIRPFSDASVVREDGRVRLYTRPDHVDEALPEHVRWHRSAEKLLGIEAGNLPMPDYISSLVPWKRDNAAALLEHVERTSGRHWFRAIAAAWNVSEYTLYGRFADDVLGRDADQFTSPTPLCLDYYKRVPLTVPELTSFLEHVGDETVAISLTSKAGMKPEDYIHVLERQWASPTPTEIPAAVREAPSRRHPAAPGRDAASGRVDHSRAVTDHGSGSVIRSNTKPRRSAGRRVQSRIAAALAVGLLLVLVIFGLAID